MGSVGSVLRMVDQYMVRVDIFGLFPLFSFHFLECRGPFARKNTEIRVEELYDQGREANADEEGGYGQEDEAYGDEAHDGDEAYDGDEEEDDEDEAPYGHARKPKLLGREADAIQHVSGGPEHRDTGFQSWMW